MNKSKKPKFTPYPPRGVFYYLFFNKSPLGDLGVKILYAFMTLLLLVFISTGKTVSQIMESSALTIKIGLLIPDSKSIAAVQGAELAVREANEKGGMNGRKFQLVVRSMEGPWGTGSKETVDLIFEEEVWALMGSHDGRNAHVVEQAATKARVVFLSAWASDPTLSQAFVPWFFNCVPNDNQQAASLIEKIYSKNKTDRIAVISENNYDSKITCDNFLKSIKTSGKPSPLLFNYDPGNRTLNVLLEEVIKAEVNPIVIFCQPSVSLEIIKQIRLKKMDKQFFGSLMLLNENELSDKDLQYIDNLLSIPSGDWSGSENLNFRQEFQKTYKKMPGMVASYSYDGMNLLIEAIRNAGSDEREKIQKSLENINFKGVTGTIQFDDKGNRIGNFGIMKTKNGVPVSSE
jgi:branched-chain amino acid transport system substrate-binding protein